MEDKGKKREREEPPPTAQNASTQNKRQHTEEEEEENAERPASSENVNEDAQQDDKDKRVTAIILAAGYGTRLERDIKADTSGLYKNLLGVPKGLVPVGDKPLVQYWVDIFKGLGEVVKKIYVVSTAIHYDQFVKWAKDYDFPVENIFNDGTTRNEERRGAVGALHYFLNQTGVRGNLIAVASDTLFFREFDIKPMLDRFFGLIDKHEGKATALVPYYELKDHAEVQRRGIIELSPEPSEEGRIIKFLEKPAPESTTSNKACPPLYFYSSRCFDLLCQYVALYGDCLDRIDAPGNFVVWLHTVAPVHGFEVAGRFDVGSLKDLAVANEYFLQKS